MSTVSIFNPALHGERREQVKADVERFMSSGKTDPSAAWTAGMEMVASANNLTPWQYGVLVGMLATIGRAAR